MSKIKVVYNIKGTYAFEAEEDNIVGGAFSKSNIKKGKKFFKEGLHKDLKPLLETISRAQGDEASFKITRVKISKEEGDSDGE